VARSRHEYLVLDIETVPDHTRWKAPERPPGVEPPFPPTWAHRVIVIGCAWIDASYGLKRLGVVGEGKELSERELLVELSKFVARARPVLVTYNGRVFDLPVIALRSLSHGVPLAWYYRDKGVRHRYSEEGHLDLCDWLADHGATRSGSLDAVVRLIGLPGKIGVDGSQVEGLYRAGQLAAIQSYCLSDVVQTAMLFLRFRVLQGVLSPSKFRAAIDAMLDKLRGDERIAPVIGGADLGQLADVVDA
jgi:predicted PolB exonuclease-like 3'-5' exonuclease